jgi:two-component system, OmpR family, phosphate regulon sensor histidine kinase PhoR
MAVNSPRNVALRSALLITGIFLVVYVSSLFFLKVSYNWWLCLSYATVIFLASFGVNYWAIEKFIHSKVKLIYKTIHRLKRRKGTEQKIKMGTDVLEEVKNDVLDWADNRVKEVRELRAQDTYRRDFIGNLAHELKTPVFNIQGYILTLLEGALEDPENNRKFLQKAAKSTERMVTLLEDLDTITRMESGTLELHKEKLDIVSLVKEVAEALEYKARRQTIEISVKTKDSKPIYVMADRSRIEQVLINLIVNSINYGNEHGHTKIRFFDLGENIMIEVSDDGIGIAEEFLPRIFERFYRVDKSRSRNFGGSGLGLAIVKHIVESHGQSISVRSAKGEGSAFSFTLKKA